jgi:hypothetical protein
MAVTQLSVFLENRLGHLNNVLTILNKNNINIRALSLTDKADYGILRLIVNDCKKGAEALKGGNLSVNSTPVIAVEVDDRPGGLSEMVKVLVDKGLNVEYMYAFVEKSGDKAVVVLRIEDVQIAETILQKEGFKLLKEKDLVNF